MKRRAFVLFGACMVLAPCMTAAEEQPVLAQEYKAEGGRPGFWWTRRLDEYTLQFSRPGFW